MYHLGTFLIADIGVWTMNYFKEIKKWIGEITEISLLLIALGIVVEILFGNTIPFFSGITTNLVGLLSSLGENGIVGLIALGIIVYLFQKKKATA
ncbi:hypothetical protein ACFL5Z_19585 [Planctomycetota bacterium]